MGEGIGHKPVKTEDELRNVDLQFMGENDPRQELRATVRAENVPAGDFMKRGLDKQDVAVKGSMITSDPPSSNMGGTDE